MPQLGSVNLTIELKDRKITTDATPLQAAVIELFDKQGMPNLLLFRAHPRAEIWPLQIRGPRKHFSKSSKSPTPARSATLSTFGTTSVFSAAWLTTCGASSKSEQRLRPLLNLSRCMVSPGQTSNPPLQGVDRNLSPQSWKRRRRRFKASPRSRSRRCV